jgi:hypothetical protein
MSQRLPFRVILTEADVGGGPAAEFQAELIGTAAVEGYVWIWWIGGGEGNGVNVLQMMEGLREQARRRGLPPPLHVEAEVSNSKLRRIFSLRYDAHAGSGRSMTFLLFW